jgi:hypothetical protein
MTNKGERVWKVTLYMTDKQWEELSRWSAPVAARETAPWLFLAHELSPEGEYEAKRQVEDMSIPEQMIYTVGSDT